MRRGLPPYMRATSQAGQRKATVPDDGLAIGLDLIGIYRLSKLRKQAMRLIGHNTAEWTDRTMAA